MSTPLEHSPQRSPQQGPQQPEGDNRGHCRYILIQDKIRGQRCACSGFIRNESLPGRTCDCGHFSCFHVSAADAQGASEAAPSAQSAQSIPPEVMDTLLRRIERLERGSNQDDQAAGLATVVARVSDLEETLERTTEEHSAENSRAFSNINTAWNEIGALKNHLKGLMRRYESRFVQIDGAFASLSDRQQSIDERQQSLDDENLSLIDRVEQLEAEDREDDEPDYEHGPAGAPPNDDDHQPRGRRGQPSSERLDSPSSGQPSVALAHRRRSSATRPSPLRLTRPLAPPSTSSPPHDVWTVHISLLPDSSLGMPFEKDTTAYKRCLSRGLHQMVAVTGSSGPAFVSAVSRAFGSLLRGREWMPLQARLCDVHPLEGLPMVRQLDQSLVDNDYDMDFLKEHCAVCHSSGKIDSMYIAMRSHSLSWQVIGNAPIFTPGLEDCWQHDPVLDGNRSNSTSAGAIVTTDLTPNSSTTAASFNTTGSSSTTTTTTTVVAAETASTTATASTMLGTGANMVAAPLVSGKKRAMSQISRTPSFGSGSTTSDSEGSRTKMQRTLPQKMMANISGASCV